MDRTNPIPQISVTSLDVAFLNNSVQRRDDEKIMHYWHFLRHKRHNILYSTCQIFTLTARRILNHFSQKTLRRDLTSNGVVSRHNINVGIQLILQKWREDPSTTTTQPPICCPIRLPTQSRIGQQIASDSKPATFSSSYLPRYLASMWCSATWWSPHTTAVVIVVIVPPSTTTTTLIVAGSDDPLPTLPT